MLVTSSWVVLEIGMMSQQEEVLESGIRYCKVYVSKSGGMHPIVWCETIYASL